MTHPVQGDIILRVTNTAICGSDLHLFLRGMPGMKSGDVLGHGTYAAARLAACCCAALASHLAASWVADSAVYTVPTCKHCRGTESSSVALSVLLFPVVHVVTEGSCLPVLLLQSSWALWTRLVMVSPVSRGEGCLVVNTAGFDCNTVLAQAMTDAFCDGLRCIQQLIGCTICALSLRLDNHAYFWSCSAVQPE